MGALLDETFNLITGGKDKDQTRAQKNAVGQFKNLETPEIDDMKVQLEELVSQGELTPEQAEAFLQEQSEMTNINLDPATRNAQLDALNRLQQIGTEGGLTDIDKAQLNQLTTELSTQEKGQRDALIQGAQQRGMGGSGLSLASQLLNQQGSAQRGSQQGMDIAAQAQQRALDAIMNTGQLSGQIRGQDYQQEADRARSQDIINQFNTQNRQNVLNQNTDRINQAQGQNLAQRQSIADANTATRNQQQQYNKNLYQQDFENRYKKAGGTAQAYQNQADTLGQQGKDRREVVGGLIETGAKAFSDKSVKENISEFSPSKFLDELTAYKYTYKEPKKMGEGEQVGVMAQDLERSAPQAVEEKDGVKMVDYNKLGGPILASLADINDRLKKIEGQ